MVLGFDANETFTDPDQKGWRANAGRGEAILAALHEHSHLLPPQTLHAPTYHPYNTAMESRRLDYVTTKEAYPAEGWVKEGSRHMARSDHDLVIMNLSTPNKHGQTAPTNLGEPQIREGGEPAAGSKQAT